MVSEKYGLSLVERAYEIAKKAHAGQVDSQKKPYITHPEFVASLCDTDEEKIVAYLHDTVEDTDVTLGQIREEFGDKIADAVAIMTHDVSVEYMEYIKKIAENPLARKVKMCDLTHNMDITRVPNPKSYHYKRVEKYKKAYEYLRCYSK